MKIQLSSGPAFLRVLYGERTITPTALRQVDNDLLIQKRTTTIRVEWPPEYHPGMAGLILEAVVSCSHLDQFSRRAGRREAMRKLFLLDNTGSLSREDRALIASVVLPVPKRNGTEPTAVPQPISKE